MNTLRYRIPRDRKPGSSWVAVLILTISITLSALGVSTASGSDAPLQLPVFGLPANTELEERLERLEGGWQHLRVSGGVSLSLSAYEGLLPGERESDEDAAPPQQFPTQTHVGARNRVTLNLQAALSEALEVSASFVSDGLFGVNYPGELALAPVAAPSLLRLEEFAAIYRTDTVWLLAGKQAFSMGPLGLLVSNTSSPIDLIDATVVRNGFAASAIVGRLSSEYYMGTDYVIDTDNYLAVRVEKQLRPDISLGVNGLLSGVGDASGQSIDLQTNLFGRPFTIELARYNPGNTITEGSYQDAHAWLARLELIETDSTSASVLYGTADKGFTPAFSGLASSSGATTNLIHNAQNLTAEISRYIGSGLSLAGEVSVSRFLDSQFAEQTRMGQVYPQLMVSITASKQIAPYSAVSATISHIDNEEVSFRRFGIDLQLNF